MSRPRPGSRPNGCLAVDATQVADGQRAEVAQLVGELVGRADAGDPLDQGRAEGDHRRDNEDDAADEGRAVTLEADPGQLAGRAADEGLHIRRTGRLVGVQIDAEHRRGRLGVPGRLWPMPGRVLTHEAASPCGRRVVTDRAPARRTSALWAGQSTRGHLHRTTHLACVMRERYSDAAVGKVVGNRAVGNELTHRMNNSQLKAAGCRRHTLASPSGAGSGLRRTNRS